jgi:hypothetical protein
VDIYINTGESINVYNVRRLIILDLYNNMEFEMKKSFIANISNAETLRIVEVNPGSIVVQMKESGCRGVFPVDSFQYWIKRNSLIYIEENQQKTS